MVADYQNTGTFVSYSFLWHLLFVLFGLTEWPLEALISFCRERVFTMNAGIK